jgi:SAM-dependent methyltransferase
VSAADRGRQVDDIAAASLARGDATGWFETVYAADDVAVPWDRPTANPLLTDWASGLSGAGRTAVVVGCGLGRDAEFVASLGFTTTAFDVAATAVRTARERNPGSAVDYRVADLLDLPAAWSAGFDLVVESHTVQALPRAWRAAATAGVRALTGAGGTLLVIAAVQPEDAPVPVDPPWPLTRPEIDAFGTDGLLVGRVETFPDTSGPSGHRWRATFTRS